jgi:predicted Zn-dependent peptidase
MSRWLRPVVGLALLLALCLGPQAANCQEPAKQATEIAPIDVKELTLDNGLRIFVVERPASPTFAAVYQFKVGGAFDPKGVSGIAHLLEHMMFKGTTKIGTLDAEKELSLMRRLSELWGKLQTELDRRANPFEEADEERIATLEKEIEEVSTAQKALIVKNEYDEIMTRAGAAGLNASTSHDATSYYIQLPSNRLELWFQMESDRLLNPVFREFFSERDVIQEERRLRYENRPRGMMYEGLLSLVFQANPYGRPNIGWPADIQRMRREDAEEYFRTYYSPSNCNLVLVGDVDAEEVERLAAKYFSPWKRQAVPPLVLTTEPPQNGERRKTIEFDAEPQLSLAWPSVMIGHDDEAALDVLAMVLGGLQSSRLDKTLVQGERLATRVSSGHSSRQHAGYFQVSATTRGEHTTAELESAIEAEIAKIKSDGITADELERAKIRVETSRVRSLKSNSGQAFRIVTSVRLSGGTEYLQEAERRIGAVTADEVKSVADRYLVDERKSVVVLLKNPDAGSASRGGSDVAHQRGGNPGKRGEKHSTGFASAMTTMRAAAPVELKVPEIGKDVDRLELESGITVFIKEDHSAPSIDMSFSWLGGSNSMPVEELAPFELASDLLSEGGTESLDPLALEERLDALGMRFNLYLGSTQGGAQFWSLSRNFDDAFALAMEILQKPRLDEDRLETLKGQYIESMKRRYESPGYGSYLIQRHVIFHDHARLGYSPTRKEILAITPEQIRTVWKRFLGRDNLFLTVVGDFDKKAMLATIKRSLGDWRKAEDDRRKWITWKPVIRPGVYLTEKDLPQPSLRIGHQIQIDRSAPMKDHAAIEILNDILGGSGFRSRLMERLRSDEGLTYGIYSGVSHQGRPGVPGAVSISYQTRKDAVVQSIDSVIEEFRKIILEEVSAAEVEEQIEAWQNRFVFRYTNEFYSVARLMWNELDDRPYDYDRQELVAVQKVKVEDVQRVAKKYLAPNNLLIAIYGSLEHADREALAERFKLELLPRDEIFKGGFDEVDAEVETGLEVTLDRE